MTFLSPLGALVALAVVIPLGVFALLELRSRRVSPAQGFAPAEFKGRVA